MKNNSDLALNVTITHSFFSHIFLFYEFLFYLVFGSFFNRNATEISPSDAFKKDSKKKKEKKPPKKKKAVKRPASKIEDSDDEGNRPEVKKRKVESTDEIDDQSMTFSSFDLSTGKPVPSYLIDKIGGPNAAARAAAAAGGKKPKQKKMSTRQLLAKVERDKKAGRINLWDSAEKRMRGEKVKDNVSLIRKKLRTERRKRVKSAVQWNERKKSVEEKIRKRQELREKHIKERIDAKYQRKLDKVLGKKKSKNNKKDKKDKKDNKGQGKGKPVNRKGR